MLVGWLYWGLTPPQQLRSYHGGRWRTCVSWLSHTLTNTTFFPKPPTTFLTCFCRGERRKYVGKEFCLNQVSNSQPPGHESYTLTTDPPGRSYLKCDILCSTWINRVLELYGTFALNYILTLISDNLYRLSVCTKQITCSRKSLPDTSNTVARKRVDCIWVKLCEKGFNASAPPSRTPPPQKKKKKID